MEVSIVRKDNVWTIIYGRAETRDAMDPESAKALFEAKQLDLE